jgi:hypothetical protein
VYCICREKILELGFCEHCNETSGSIKGPEFIEQFSDYQFMKEYAPTCSLIIKMIKWLYHCCFKARKLESNFLHILNKNIWNY